MKKTRRTGPPVFQSCQLEPLEPRCLLSAQPILYTDLDGTAVKISLAGNGAMSLTPNAETLTLTGADQGTRLRITTKGGDGRTVLGSIVVDGAIKSITGTGVDLTGNISIAGSIRAMKLGDMLAGSPHTLTIGGTAAAKPASLNLRRVTDLSIDTHTPVNTLAVTDWDDTGTDDLIAAPGLKNVTSKEDLAPSVRLESDQPGDAALGKVRLKGVLSGVWSINGDVSSISAGSTAAGFRINVLGQLNKLATKSDFHGVLAAVDIGSVSIGGNASDAKLLAGADLGADAQIGGSGDARDLYFQGTIGNVSIKGQATGSVIGAGLDPANAVFGDGDDFVTGKIRSTIKSLRVVGIADSQSLFAAGQFNRPPRVGGTRIDPAGDPRFLLASTAPDETPPVITAALRNDTGNPSDNITSDPTIVGRVTDLGTVRTFMVGIDAAALDAFASIRSLVNPDGTFELLRAKIEKINGGPLTPGPHTINFLAKDEIGNTAALFTVTFVFAP